PRGETYMDVVAYCASMIRSPAAGMGEYSSDELFRRVKQIAAEVWREQAKPGMEIGYAGSIPNAIIERNALVDDIATVSILATTLLLASIVLFFWSLLSLWHIGICVATGCGLATPAPVTRW
ncbi:MAG: hypothetical protein ACWGPN_13090, partial [Gammaproteobacteria bacterium]